MSDLRIGVFVAALVMTAACRQAPPTQAQERARGRPCQEISIQCYHRRAPKAAIARCREIAYEGDVDRCRSYRTACVEACRTMTEELEVPVPVPDGATR